MSNESIEVVIVGGGYVGFHAYRTLMSKVGRRVRSGEIRITLIDPETAHTFHGWSGETLAGVISDGARRSPFRSIFRHARVVRGYVTRIDEARRRVEVRTIDGREGRTIGYHHLVLGIGVGDDPDLIPGIREFGHGLRGVGGPEGLRELIISRLEEAESETNPDRRARLLSFIVAGGGFTGVETAAAIAEYLRSLRPRYEALREGLDRVTLVHSGRSILEQMSGQSRLIDYATRALVASGIHVRLGIRAERLEQDRLILSDGSSIESGTVISTVGCRVRSYPGSEAWDRDRSGRIVVDRYLGVAGAKNIWAGGDGAHVRSAYTGAPTPANALWAIRHGEQIGKNISALLTGRALHPFTNRGLGQAASLGIGKGVVELKGMQFTGWTGWIMRILFFLYFVPSRRTAFRGLTEWLAFPITGRDVSSGRHIGSGGLRPIGTELRHWHSNETRGRLN